MGNRNRWMTGGHPSPSIVVVVDAVYVQMYKKCPQCRSSGRVSKLAQFGERGRNCDPTSSHLLSLRVFCASTLFLCMWEEDRSESRHFSRTLSALHTLSPGLCIHKTTPRCFSFPFARRGMRRGRGRRGGGGGAASPSFLLPGQC